MAQRRIMKVEPVQKKWLSMQEAMAYLGCSERFLREFLSSTYKCNFLGADNKQ